MFTHKRIIVWIIISFVLQLSMYLFLDKFYFTDETNIQITQVGQSSQEVHKSGLTIPEGSSSVGVSYNGDYISFYDQDRNLTILSSTDQKSFTVPLGQGAKWVGYKWLQDANNLILTELIRSGTTRQIRFYSFDVQKLEKMDIGNYSSNTDAIQIRENSVIVDIELSTLTGVMYAKVTQGEKLDLYRIDRNEKLTHIPTKTTKMGVIKVASHDDLIAYEDLSTHQIYTSSEYKVLQDRNESKLTLLDADGQNRIYAGNYIQGKLDKIYEGKLSDPLTKWEQVSLNERVDPKQIVITQQGDIWINTLTGSIFRMNDHKNITLRGQLLSVYGREAVSLQGTQVYFQSISP